MIKIDIKALSVNQAFQGRRFKTPKYNKYINEVLSLLPQLDLNKETYTINIEFGLSSKLNDIDNGLKPFIDCLVKKYNFDDRQIYELNVKKIIVKKGSEYIKFKIK
jgi:Holliday junction resolvase RusA-like endonuclease